MTETTSGRDIIDRLNGACIGHPFARIAWPHRLLHDARAEIERLREIETAAKQWVDAVNEDNRPNRNEAEDWMMRLLS